MSNRIEDLPAGPGGVGEDLRPSPASGRTRTLVVGSLIMAGLTAALVAFSDRDGYEGDDLSVVSAVYDLDSAKAGDLDLYRYAWQPLAYEASSWAYRAVDSPDAVFLMAPISCAVALGLLLWGMSRTSRRLGSPLVHLSLLILLPELFYAGMFYNTTVLGMPMVALAILLLTTDPEWAPVPKAAVMGAMLALATLMRFDFLLLCPFFAAWLWIRRRSPVEVATLVSGSIAVVAAAAAFGLLDPQMLLKTLRVHHEEVNLGITESAFRWSWKENIKVIAVMMHPLAWALLLAGGPGLARDYARRHGWKTLALLGLSILPLVYPLMSFVSVKYAIPLLMLLPFVMQSILERASERLSPGSLRLASFGVVGLGLAVALVSIEPSKRPPFLRATLASPNGIYTCDGDRTFGAFAVSLREVGRDDSAKPTWRAANRLLGALEGPEGRDLWIVGADSSFHTGRVGWRYLRTLLARRGIHGQRVAPHTFGYEVEGRNVYFTVPGAGEAEQKRTIAPKALRVDLHDPQVTEANVDRRVEDALATAPPR